MRKPWALWALSLILLLPTGVFAAGYTTSVGDSDIMISGQKTISYRYAFALGNKNIFRSDNMVGLGGGIDEQSTFLTINGNVPDKFSITGTLSDGTYMGSQASIEVKAKNVGLYLGDISANLTGSEFGSFNKNLNGIKVEGDWGKQKFTLITSQLESHSKTETFQGNGTMGPYRLDYGWQLIEGTETVKVDGKTQLRRIDYRIDNGNLYFTNKFIYSFNTIEVSYEYSLDFNLNPGTLSGFRGTTQIGDKIHLGTTVFQQTTNRYSTGAVFRGIDSFTESEFHKAAGAPDEEGRVPYTFQVRYWPLVDNNDSEVIISVYTHDNPTSPAKSWSNKRNRWLPDENFEDNVGVDPEKGQVTLRNLIGYDEGEIGRVEIEYYYLASFPETIALENVIDDGTYIICEPKDLVRAHLVEGKAYLKYEVDSISKERELSPADFEINELGQIKINRELFDSTPDSGSVNLTFFYSLPSEKETDDSYRANRTVVTLDARAQLTPRIALQGEVGFSQGHLSADDLYFSKQLRASELVGMWDWVDEKEGDLLLYLGRFIEANYFPLPIEPMSETITVRRITGTTATFRRDHDYDINYATGVIRFTGEAASLLREGTSFESITFRYKYLHYDSLVNEGAPVRGLGAKVGATANFDKASFNINWRSLDPNFSPLGMSRISGYGSKELSRFSTGATLRPTSYLQVSSNYNQAVNTRKEKRGNDTEDVEVASGSLANEVRLNLPGWPSLTLSNNTSRSHPKDSPEVDYERVENAISTSYNWKIYNFSASMGRTDYNSHLGEQYEQHTMRRNLTLGARPSSKFNTNYSFTNSVQLSTQQNAKNTGSDAHNLSMEFRPSNKLTFGGSYNIQLLDQLDDKRRNIQRGSLNFTNNLSSKVTLRGSLSRSMDPGSYYGGSTIDYGNLSWNYNYKPHLSFSSSLYLSDSKYGNESYSRYATLQGDVRYTPQHPEFRKKRVQLTWSNSYRPSASLWTHSTTNPTETLNRTATSSVQASFQPMPGLSLRTGYELQYNQSTGQTTGNKPKSPYTNTLTANGTYSFSYKVQATGNLRFSDNARSWSSGYSTNPGSGYGRKLEGTVGVNYTISPSARVNVDWRIIGYQDGGKIKDANYLGNVITTKLVGTF